MDNKEVKSKEEILKLIEHYKDKDERPVLIVGAGKTAPVTDPVGVALGVEHIKAIEVLEKQNVPLMVVTPDVAEEMGLEMVNTELPIRKFHNDLILKTNKDIEKLEDEVSKFRYESAEYDGIFKGNNRKHHVRKPKAKKTFGKNKKKKKKKK